MGAFKRLGDSALGGARRGLDRVLPDRPSPDAGKDPASDETADPTGDAGTSEDVAATTPVEPGKPTRIESTRKLVDAAWGPDRRDHQLSRALMSVAVVLLLLITLGSIGLVLVGLGGFPPGWEGADRIDVATAADGRPGSLRSAIEQAAGSANDTVVRLEENTTYRLTTGCEKTGGGNPIVANSQRGVLDIGAGGGLYLQGRGATIVQECAGQRVLHATTDERLHLSRVTLAGGHASTPIGGGSGGALLSEGGGAVTIEDSLLTRNRADDSGGAVALRGPESVLHLNRSVISGNSAGSSGGGVSVVGELDATNTTITDNRAKTNGGAVATDIGLTFSTVVDNSVRPGAAGGQLGTANLTSFASYVAGGIDASESCSVERTESGGYNVSDDSSCGFGDGLGDLTNGPSDAVGLLGTYSKAIPARPPVAGSVLVDRVPSPACLAKTDIDGQERSRGGDDASCDVGAIEHPEGLRVPLTATAATAAKPVPGEANYTG